MNTPIIFGWPQIILFIVGLVGVVLNGGDDNFFKAAYAQKSWFSWFVDASYGNAVFQAPGAFDVFATQDALIARPAG